MENFLQLSYLGKTNFIVAIKSLALLANENRLVTRNTLTEKLRIDSSFIRKILAKLMQENVVEGFGERYGGYKLIDGKSKKFDYIGQFIIEVVLKSQQKIEEILSKYTIHTLSKGASHE